MIIQYDKNPNLTVDQKMQSLIESIQMALNELNDKAEPIIKAIKALSKDKGDAGDAGDYSALSNKPQINSVDLAGNKTSEQINVVDMTTPKLNLDTTATSGSDKEIYDALVALGWTDCII